jgi:hypothetical protein
MNHADLKQKNSDSRHQAAQRQRRSVLQDNRGTVQYAAEQKPNKTGLPDQLKSGIENLSGHAMDDVKVHYNSTKPVQMNAHAYAQGSDIHLAPGQEKHLPHEAWHVVQQKQGRVKPTMQMKSSVNINDDPSLEKEADIMGSKAMQLHSHTPRDLVRKPIDTKNEPIQRVELSPEQWFGVIAIGGTALTGAALLLRQWWQGRNNGGGQHGGGQHVPQPQPQWLPAVHPNGDDRSADPYELQNGQVHHIIAHTHLLKGLNHLGQQDQYEVRREYLPSLNQLTIRQLSTTFQHIRFFNPDPSVAPANNTIDRHHQYFGDAAWSTQPISQINENITIQQGNYINTNIAGFKAAYNGVKNGQGPGGVGQNGFWEELMNSFFEWSGGNLFYGAQQRAEPGGGDLDEFDSDATYFRDRDHVRRLQQAENELRQANQRQDALGGNQAQIRDLLINIGQRNRDVGAGPVNDRTKWIKPQDNHQKAVILALLPGGARKDYIAAQGQQKALPKDFVSELIRGSVVVQLRNAIGNNAVRANLSGVIGYAAHNIERWRGNVTNDIQQTQLPLWGINFTVIGNRNGHIRIEYHGFGINVDVSQVSTLQAAQTRITSAFPSIINGITI